LVLTILSGFFCTQFYGHFFSFTKRKANAPAGGFTILTLFNQNSRKFRKRFEVSVKATVGVGNSFSSIAGTGIGPLRLVPINGVSGKVSSLPEVAGQLMPL
jgi:hypothetical protein